MGKPRTLVLRRNEAHIRDTLELVCPLYSSIFVHRHYLDIEFSSQTNVNRVELIAS